MPIVISADKWKLDSTYFAPYFTKNHDPDSDMLKKIDEMETLVNMQEVDKLLMNSPLYLKGKTKSNIK